MRRCSLGRARKCTCLCQDGSGVDGAATTGRLRVTRGRGQAYPTGKLTLTIREKVSNGGGGFSRLLPLHNSIYLLLTATNVLTLVRPKAVASLQLASWSLMSGCLRHSGCRFFGRMGRLVSFGSCAA